MQFHDEIPMAMFQALPIDDIEDSGSHGSNLVNPARQTDDA